MPDLPAYRRGRRRARTLRLGTGALGLAVLAGIWQLVAMLLNDPVFLPSASQTACARCFCWLTPAGDGEP